MKTYILNRRHAARQFSSLAIATIAMAFTMNSCQDYEYGFTETEIHATAVQRHYVEAFHQQFPEVDPHHTWMYEPVQTFVTDNGSPLTRAGITEPIVQDFSAEKDSALRIDANVVDAILTHMEEAQDNLKKITSSFEYLAVTETTYDIWPVLWGEKFCQDNKIGIYIVNPDGSIRDLGTLWSDTDENVLMGYKDQTEAIKNSTRPVNRDITKGWRDNTLPMMSYSIVVGDCDVCHGTGETHCTGTVQRNGNNWQGYTYKCDRCGKTYSKEQYDNLGRQHKCNNMVSCARCNGSGQKTQTDKVNPEYYLFPHYKVTMPAGTKWGIYLNTRKQQNSNSRVTWYSNPKYNNGKDNVDLTSIIAAGTFTFGGITYCCFEDAPCSKTGYQSFDHDYNDFMLQITPRPVESTYNSSEVRIMCEDLGGTFDWDFNDIVYDLKFVQGAFSEENAKITITLQAVGGTLPIHMIVDGENLGELHELYASERIDEEGLYEPINVGKGRSVGNPKVLKVIDLGQKKMDDGYDFRQIVHKISLVVCENHYSTRADSESATIISHTINFPDAEGDQAPQCFMTSIGTEWPSECVKISDKYNTFNDWVENESRGRGWNDWTNKQF